MRIDRLNALEVLDSRGRPTVEVTLTTERGQVFSAGVPSGASKGTHEAVELRDGDPERYGGHGVLGAVAAVNGPLADLLIGREWPDLAEVDAAMCAADGTPDKSRLGANAIVGLSMACARAFAAEADVPLYRYLTPDGVEPRLPVPHFNVLNGGAHAQNALSFQEFMIAPAGASSFAQAVRAGAEVYAALRTELSRRSLSTGLGDEGGFAPEISAPEEACSLLVTAIEQAGYHAGPDGVLLALDPAANGFVEESGGYRVTDAVLSAADMVDLYAGLIDRFPIWSIEDGLAEDDRDGWRAMTERLGHWVQLVGDDIFVTNADTVRAAARDGVANATLLKVNQAGTVTETLDAADASRQAGYAAMVSHRSGETSDAFIADLTVALGCGQLKSGAPARGERVAKYNRLLSIATAEPGLGFGLPLRAGAER